jgi:hypothetical protein
MVTDVERMVVRGVGEVSTISGGDQSLSLALETNCSKSVDPKTVTGTSKDELAISYITNIYGLLYFATFTTAQTAGTNLLKFYVTPCGMYPLSTGYMTTPLAQASLLFARWSGDLVYKITLVCSQYHRGRIRIYWNQLDTITDPVLNTTLVSLLEVEPGASTEFTTPWNTVVPSRPTQAISIGTAITTPNTSTNGFLFIDVDQQLVAPRAGADCKVIVQVKAGKNFKLFNPTAQTLRYASFSTYNNKAEVTVNVPATTAAAGTYTPLPQSKELNTEVDTSYLVPEVFGEQTGSLRPLLKRYSYYTTQLPAGQVCTAAAPGVFMVDIPRFPTFRFSDGTIRRMRGFTVIAYLMPSYLLVSGSTRIKFHLATNVNGTSTYLLNYMNPPTTVSRKLITGDLQGGYVVNVNPVTGIIPAAADNAYGGSFSGSAITDCTVNPFLEIENPDMYGLRARNTRTIMSFAADYGVSISQLHTFGTVSNNYTIWYAGGDDLSFFAYVGPPILYFWGPSSL